MRDESQCATAWHKQCPGDRLRPRTASAKQWHTVTRSPCVVRDVG